MASFARLLALSRWHITSAFARMLTSTLHTIEKVRGTWVNLVSFISCQSAHTDSHNLLEEASLIT
jgi:hypothetical protein